MVGFKVKLAEMLSRHKHSLHDPAVPDVRDIRVCWKVILCIYMSFLLTYAYELVCTSALHA